MNSTFAATLTSLCHWKLSKLAEIIERKNMNKDTFFIMNKI